jgi:hypothetical protein
MKEKKKLNSKESSALVPMTKSGKIKLKTLFVEQKQSTYCKWSGIVLFFSTEVEPFSVGCCQTEHFIVV